MTWNRHIRPASLLEREVVRKFVDAWTLLSQHLAESLAAATR
jgi:hypothetical protein